jgi:hypothetical protein
MTACALTLAACGSSSTSPSPYPKVGGQYTTTLTYALSATGIDSTAVLPGSINMLDANRAGQFTGTWLITGSGSDTATGVVVGDFNANGSAISWVQFGDGGAAPPLYVHNILVALYPACNFAEATVSQPAAGGISGAQLTLAGTFGSFKCLVGADSVNATLSAHVSGFRLIDLPA